jgi:hypothetical protein
MDQQQGQYGQEQEQAQGQVQEQQAWPSQQPAQTEQGQTQQANQSGQNWTASTGGDWPGTPAEQDGAVQNLQASQSGQGGAEQVVAVRKNGDGDIVEMKLSSGEVVDYKTAQSMSKQGILQHTNVFKGRDGEEHLRSDADGDPSNNLDNLPTF